MRFHAAAEGKRLKEGRLGRSTSSSGEAGGCCFSMDGGDGLGCNAGPGSANASPLVGFEGFSCDVCVKVAEELEIPSSIPHGDDVNIDCVGRRGLMGEEESVASASDLSVAAKASMAASKLVDETGVGEEAQKMVAGEEQHNLTGLFPLRGDGLGISPNLEVDYIDKNRDCSVDEDALLVSSRSAKALPLMAFDRDLAGQGGSFLSNKFMDVSEMLTGNWVEGRCETFSVAESDEVKSNICSGKVTCMDGRKEEVNQLCSMQNVEESPVQYSRKQKEMSDRGGSSCLVILEEERIAIPHFEKEASCSEQGAPSELIHCSALEGSLSERPSHPLASVTCCSKGSTEPDIEEGNFYTFARSDGCSSGNGLHGEADRGSGTVDVFRRTNPKRGASLRSNLADEKFNQLFRIRNDRRKCRRKLSSSSFSSKLTTKIFSEVKRKRRDSERQARLSLWGALESLFHIIKQDCEFTKHDSQVIPTVRKSKKAKSGVVRRKGVPALRNGLSHLSESKRASSSRRIMVDSKAFLQNGVNHIMLTSDGHADSGSSNTIVQLEQNSAGQMCNALVRSTQRSVQHGDKDLESSLTEETSVDNLPGEYYGILSRVNIKSVQETVDHKQLSDPGTSPDSLVYDPPMDVGVIASEDSVSTQGGCRMDQKILFQDPKTDDRLPSAAPTFIETFAAPSISAKDTLAFSNPNRSKELLKENKGKKGKKVKKENKGREKKGKRNSPVSECPQTFSDHSGEAKVDSPGLNMSMKASSNSKCDLKEQHASVEGVKCSKSVRKHSKGGLKSERCSVDSSPGLPELACFGHSMEVKMGQETSKMPLQIVSKGQQSKAILHSGNVKGHQLSRSAKMELHKGIPSHGDSTRCRRHFNHGHHKRNRWKSDFESKKDILLGENGHIDFTAKITNKLARHEGEMGSKIDGSDALFKDISNNIAMPVSSGPSARELYHVLLDQSLLSGQKAWALCDECQKWRCIPEELVHAIENTKWTCQDNVDESFADCTIPQEKTNEVINKELEISDEEDCSTAQPGYWDTASQRKTSVRRASWTLIKSNMFLNRSPKTQTIDEIMVCYCKPPKDGGLGCHDECLNRMLNIECVKGTCPCGELCSNQQFQKRKYAKFKWIKCGRKGYGLQLEEDVSRGQFLIEYVGEVLDLAAYEARLGYYASRGHKHFYFMTLNGGEVIDACGKGNLGRFINHSCDPNCRTEKWMVNGEVCIGLFAIRDIKKGEEVTFDYNYVRVFGAAAKKCVCGAAECQGYIGGDPSKSEVIVQDDSAEEDIEPLMIVEDGEIEQAVKGTDTDATATKVIKLEDASIERDSTQWNPSLSDQGASVQNEDNMHQPSSEPNQIDPLQQFSDCTESGHTMFGAFSDIQESQDMKLVLSSTEPDEAFCASANDDQPLCTISGHLLPRKIPDSSKHNRDNETDHSIQESILDVSTKASLQNSDSTLHKKKLITYPVEENPNTSKPFDLVKSSRPIKIKRSKANIKSMASQKAKKVQNSMNGHIEGVEEKLNELLDVDGGISRHKDSAKWYLKLLVVTAAAGDDIKGGLSQSARDLSLILDAILKTKSRTVLVDIINKNGLQMLHNMLKQNRDNFNRIPILRKLLKVLEFLAEKQILTLEHINGPPPCNGMESFKESMLKLMKHRDSQVHNIARNFADHWIPRTVRRFEPSDRDSRQLNSKCFHHSWAQASKFKAGHDHRKWENDSTFLPTVPSAAEDITGEAYAPYQQVSISTSLAGSNLIDATRPRKRKSRWDQPSGVSTLGSQTSHSTGEPFSVFDVSIQKSGTVSAGNNSSKEAAPAADLLNQISDDDDMPPGFGFPCMDNHPQSSCMIKDVTREVVIAHTQEKYLPYLPVSFGMPIVLTQQLGTPEVDGNNQFDSSWKIAPAMPFKPFPPLPLYPRRESDRRNAGTHILMAL